MKKIVSILIMLLALLVLTSCNDELIINSEGELITQYNSEYQDYLNVGDTVIVEYRVSPHKVYKRVTGFNGELPEEWDFPVRTYISGDTVRYNIYVSYQKGIIIGKR